MEWKLSKQSHDEDFRDRDSMKTPQMIHHQEKPKAKENRGSSLMRISFIRRPSVAQSSSMLAKTVKLYG
jgi:hypothetical protein